MQLSNLYNNTAKKLMYGMGVVAVVAGLFLSGPHVSGAATVAELQAQLNALLAQLSALQGGVGSGAGCYAFTRDLTEGSQGADVTALQNFLASKGHFSVAATGYFGPITRASVASWQSASGIMPAAGYFGPISRAAYNAACTPVISGGGTGTGIGDGTSGGGFFSGKGEGSLIRFSQISKYANEKVGVREEDVTVLGVEFEADGTDQMIERVTVVIDTPSKASEDKLDDFIEDVSVWLNNEELGRMRVRDASYTRSSDRYTFRFVGLEGILEEGDTGELTVAVTGPRSVSSDTTGEGWNISIPTSGIRASSPNGVTETYDGEGNGRLGPEKFTVESFASANNVKLTARRDSDTPIEQVVVGDDNDEFDAELLAFELEASGSDIEIFGLEIDLYATGAGNPEDLTNRLDLSCAGSTWSKSVGSGTVVFDRLNLSVREGRSVTCMVSAEMNEIDGGTFAEGDSLRASLDVSSIDAEDETGKDLDGNALRGSANGYRQTFVSKGILISNVSAKTPTLVFTASKAGETSQGQFVVEFDVTANDTDVWLDRSVTATTTADTPSAGDGIVYFVDMSGAANFTGNSAVLSCVSNCGSSGDNSPTDYFIAEGDTERYRLTVVLTGDTNPTPGNFRIWISHVNWATANATANQFYTAGLGEDTEATTPWIFLNAL